MSLYNIARRKLSQKALITYYYHRINDWIVSSIYAISPALLARLRFVAMRGRLPDFTNPKSFDEKLLWLNLYWRHPLKAQCGDKFMMRSYVEKQGFGHILPRLLGVYETSNDIDFNALPDRFVLKCTHGCKFNIICTNKHELKVGETKQQLDSWMKIDFSKVYGETHYSMMKPRIICERFLDDLTGELPCDYKIYCFGGKVHCTLACTERGLDVYAKYDLYDREWKHKLPYSKSSLLANRDIPKPAAYEQMLEAAEELSKPFPFVRMDFYNIDGRAVLGEMTFTPCCCVDKGYTDLAQRELGALITLPRKLLD